MEVQDFVMRLRKIWSRLSQRHHLIFSLVILLLFVGFLLIGIIRNAFNIVSVIFAGLAVLLAAAAWLYPGTSTAFTRRSSLDPPAEPSEPVRSERIVRGIYNQLIDPDCSAIMLLGLNGIGASSFAKQVFMFVKDRRVRFFFKRKKRRTNGADEGNQGTRDERSYFKRVLWVGLDEESTLSELARTLGLHDVSQLRYDHQADLLLKYVDTAKKRWLIVLDFKNPLSKQTREALADHPGFSEFLLQLNGRACESRFLLTSRPWPAEKYSEQPNYLQQYFVGGLGHREGRALLEQCNVEGEVDEHRWVIAFCRGHAGALRILPRVLAGPPAIDLFFIIENENDRESWVSEVTREYLEHIYEVLSDVEQKMLFAFSIYRRPVQLQAVQAVMGGQFNVRPGELREAHRKLLNRCFFLNTDGDRYQVHPLVAWHALHHFGDSTHSTHLQEAHRRAAEYYERDAKRHIGPGLHDERAALYIEAIYHLLKAGDDGAAYRLLEEKKLLRDLL